MAESHNIRPQIGNRFWLKQPLYYNGEPIEKFKDYARLRVEAMVLRDNKKEKISENDWHTINDLCVQSWQAIYSQLHP